MRCRVIKWLFAVSFLSLFLPAASFANTICGPDAVDPDGDGWGWENGASCRVTVVEPPVPPMCTGVDSDPDGDGWGWENGASCKVGQQVGPGDNFETASLVELDTSISATIVGTMQHYYKFEVNNSVGVELQSNFNSSGSLDFFVSDGVTTVLDTSYWSDDTQKCLQLGTYYLVLDRRFIDTSDTIDYTVSAQTTALPCVEPKFEYALPAPDLVVIDRAGYVYWHGWEYDAFDSALSKRDLSGVVLWEITQPYLNFIKIANDGSLLIGGYGTYARLDASDGRELWRVDINADYVYEDDLVVGDQSFVMHENDVVRSHSLSDGSERWRYDVEGYASIRTMRMTSDGQVVVITDESVLTFPE